MPTKKKTVKKSAKKSSRPLVSATGDRCFWMTDGRILSNLVDLSASLENMAADVFKHHVTKDKNDFADWIEHVLDDAELAKKVRTSRKPSSARTVIIRRLRIYEV